MNTIYTIGHSIHETAYFIKLLKEYDINLVLDLRSSPYSKQASQFNRDAIRRELENNRIKYNFLGDIFGGRQKDPNLYSDEGIVVFDKVKEDKKFKKGINEVIDKINSNNIVLMCSEKEPLDCHRSILISKVFSEKGIDVKHILGDGNIESHKSLENRLLKLYGFPTKSQKTLSFFDKNMADVLINHLEEAYKKRNKDIGYKFP
jgi:uncharacterized protein (DUF488 family)